MDSSQKSPGSPGAASRPDVIGLGAFNVDFIASASRLSARAEERIIESDSRLEANTEGPVSEETITRTMRQLGAHSLDASLGGSAWNTIFALANMYSGVNLGFVGVLGRIEAPGLSFLRQMESLGIDHRLVSMRPDLRSGMCLSFIEDEERVLLTSPGANLEMAQYVRANLDGLADYLSAAKLVHITSFLDPVTPSSVVELIHEATRRNPRLIVSFDPGHEWATNPTPAVQAILAMTNLLFVNYQELKMLGQHSHGELDDVLGRRVAALCSKYTTIFVTKRYDLIEVFSSAPSSFETLRFTYDFKDPEKEIEDATGVGDVFAAAVISAMFSQQLKLELGAHLGLSLARHKLRYMASDGHSRFPDLTRGFLQSKEELGTVRGPKDTVLIAHDGAKDWTPLKDFLSNYCGLRITELTPTDPQSLPSSLSRRQLDESGFAVCVLAPDHSRPRRPLRANERLVHYAGFLQGRYGFDRVALLVEEDCEVFSNMAGLIRLDFRPGHVQDAFVELERMLRREGLMP